MTQDEIERVAVEIARDLIADTAHDWVGISERLEGALDTDCQTVEDALMGIYANIGPWMFEADEDEDPE